MLPSMQPVPVPQQAEIAAGPKYERIEYRGAQGRIAGIAVKEPGPYGFLASLPLDTQVSVFRRMGDASPVSYKSAVMQLQQALLKEFRSDPSGHQRSRYGVLLKALGVDISPGAMENLKEL